MNAGKLRKNAIKKSREVDERPSLLGGKTGRDLAPSRLFPRMGRGLTLLIPGCEGKPGAFGLLGNEA